MDIHAFGDGDFVLQILDFPPIFQTSFLYDISHLSSSYNSNKDTKIVTKPSLQNAAHPAADV